MMVLRRLWLWLVILLSLGIVICHFVQQLHCHCVFSNAVGLAETGEVECFTSQRKMHVMITAQDRKRIIACAERMKISNIEHKSVGLGRIQLRCGNGEEVYILLLTKPLVQCEVRTDFEKVRFQAVGQELYECLLDIINDKTG
jgi:hypothetical protein